MAGSTGSSVRGIVSAVVAAVLYATLIVSNKSIKHVSGLASTLAELFIGFFVVLAYLLAIGDFPFALPSGRGLVYVVILGLVNSGIACWLYFSSMQRLPGQTVALCCYVDPLSAVVFSALFLGERMGPVQIIGAVLILGGALFGELKFRRKVPEEAA